MKKLYYCNNKYLEDYLFERNIQPLWYSGKTAVYEHDKQFAEIMNDYYIKYVIFNSRF